MTTPRVRSLVSFAAALTLALSLGACTGASSRLAQESPAPVDGSRPTVRFDNGAREYVHVYLVSDKREWLLGRVEPGARATLRIPEEALAGNPGEMRLAVLAGGHLSLRVAGESRAAMTMAQPTSALLSQQWTFSQSLAQGQLTPLRSAGASAAGGRQ